MGRRPPPRRRKRVEIKELCPPEPKKEYEPKTVIMFGKAGAVDLVAQLEQVRGEQPLDAGRCKWDETPLGSLLKTMKRNA